MMDLQIIHNRIYEFRGVKVMIDRDLAEMYGVETRALNQAVKRNIERFPADFMFQLTEEEFKDWKSQIVISNSIVMGLRRAPFAFSELGVSMLSTVLNSKIAIQVNINIMRAFVAMRQHVLTVPMDKYTELKKEVLEIKEYIEDVITDYNDINEDTRMQLKLINESLAELQFQRNKDEKARPVVGYVKPDESKMEGGRRKN